MLKFYYACQSGNIDVVKQIVEDGIDIHNENEAGFRYAYSYGHINIVEYLTSLNIIDIHIHGAEGFRMACYYKHTDIIYYLIKLSKQKPYTPISIISSCLSYYSQNFKNIASIGVLHGQPKFLL